MLRNEELYPDPDTFNPDRYLVEVDPVQAKLRDPRIYVFGFGRRKCPGSHLIEQSLWIVMATFLATTDFGKAKDASGKEVEPVVAFENSVFRLAFLNLDDKLSQQITDLSDLLLGYPICLSVISVRGLNKLSSSFNRPRICELVCVVFPGFALSGTLDSVF